MSKSENNEVKKNNNNSDSKSSKIKELLFTDRGGTNSKEIFNKIPYKYLEGFAFTMCIYFILLLNIEQITKAFFWKSYMERLFFLGGTVAEIFAVFYMARFFVIEKKPKFSEFIKEHIWDILLFIMLPIAFVSALGSEAGELSFKGVPIRHDGFYSYLIYASVYVCAKAVKNNRLRRWIIRAMGLAVSILSVNTVIQNNSDWIERMGQVGINIIKYSFNAGIYYNINHFAYVLTIGIMSLAVLVVIEEKKILKALWLVLEGFTIWALIINNTFGSFVAVMLGMIFLAIVMLVSDKKRWISVIAVLLVFIGVCVVTDIKTEILRDNFIKTSDDATNITKDEGGSGRIGLWKQTIDFIKEKPLIGYGPEGLYLRMDRREIENDVPHNEYLQYMLYLGIPGGLCYIAALICLFITMVKKIKYLPKELLAMGVVVFSYCVSAFFGVILYNTVVYYFIFLGGISSCGIIKKESENVSENA